MDLIPGSNVGPYRLIEQIGMGGMATVYKAYHAAMDRHVALKILPRQFAKDSTYLGRFQQEARTIANLEHPHILPVYDFGADDDLTYLVMRLLETGTLKERISAGRLPVSEIDHLFGQTAEALDYAHSRGVIHRDVKPSNVLIDPHGNAFLTDFGVAKLLESTSQFTASGGLLGTPAYMAPEQAQGIPADARSDIYALGIVLYEMCTGRVPFDAETPLAIVLKHINDPLPLPRDINPAIPDAVQDVILKALAKNPDERFQTTGAMLAVWRQALGSLAQVDQPFGPGLDALREATHAAISPPTVEPAAPQPTPVPEQAAAEPPAVAAPAPAAAAAPQKAKRRRRRWWWLALPAGVFLCLCFLLFASQAGKQRSGVAQTGSRATNVPSTVPVDVEQDVSDVGEPEEKPDEFPTGGEVIRDSFVWESFANGNDVRTAVAIGDKIWTAGVGGVVIWDIEAETFKHWSAPETLPFNGVNSILVEEDGGVWFGAEFGLVRREPDGAVEHFDTNDGLDSDWVGPVGRESDGSLIVGTRYGKSGLNRYKDGQWEIINWPSTPDADANDLTQASSNVRGIYGSMADTAVVATDSGLAVLEDSGWTILKQAHGLPSDEVLAFYVDREGLPWIGTAGGAVVVIEEEGRLEPVPPLEEMSVFAIYQDVSGMMWFGLGGGVARLDPATEEWEFFSDEDGLPGWTVTAIVEDGKGGLWFGTEGGGLAHFTGERFEPWLLPNQPMSYSFHNILPHPDGRLMVSPHYSGMFDFYDPAAGKFTSDELPEDAMPMAVEPDGTVWAGSSYAGLWRIDDEKRQYTIADGLPSNLVKAVAVDSEGYVWVGTDAGLARFDGHDGEFDVFDSAGGDLPSDEVHTVYAATDGRVWVGADSGGSLYEDGDWRWLTPDDVLHPATTAITDIAEGPAGTIWLGTEAGGLVEFLPDEDEWIVHYDELPDDSPLVVAVDPIDGSVWLSFPYVGGVAHQEGEKWPLQEDLQLAHPQVLDIHIDKSGEIYFATYGGLTRWGP